MYVPPPGRPQSTPPDSDNDHSSTSIPKRPQRRPGESDHEYGSRILVWLYKNDPEWAAKRRADLAAIQKVKRSKQRAALRALNKVETRGVWMVGRQFSDAGVFKSETSLYGAARQYNFEERNIRGLRAFLIPHNSKLMRRYNAALDGSRAIEKAALKKEYGEKTAELARMREWYVPARMTEPAPQNIAPPPPTLWQRIVGWFR